jgi:hypothetical protein
VFPVLSEDLTLAGGFCRAFMEISNNDEIDSTRKVASLLHLLIKHMSEHSHSTYTTNLLVTKALVKLTSDFDRDHFGKDETPTINDLTIEMSGLRLHDLSAESAVLRGVEIKKTFGVGRFLLDVEERVSNIICCCDFDWLT